MASTDANLRVATVGLHGSASTWVYNVARELLGADEALAFYADRVDEIPPDAATRSRVLVKSHHGSPELDAWFDARPTRLILSLRDPRDAAISMAQRFQAPLRHTVMWLRNDCERMLRLLPRPHLRLTYEDRFFERPETVARLAAALGLSPPPSTCADIFAAYGAEAVRAFAARLATLPPERLNAEGRFPMDRLTHIHAPHIGDGASGKWKALPPETRAALGAAFRPYLEAFGYQD